MRSLLFFLLIAVLPAFGQQSSLSDSNRVLKLHELGRAYISKPEGPGKNKMTDTAIAIFNHAIRLSDTLRLENLRIKSMFLEGVAWCVRGDDMQGEKKLLTVAALYHQRGNTDLEADTWFRLAIHVHSPEKGHNDLYFKNAITLYEQTHAIKKEADTYKLLADHLFESDRYNEVEKALLQALKLYYQVENIPDITILNIYYSLSMINRYCGSYEKALSYAIKCKDLAAAYHETANIDFYYGELALVYDELGLPEQSSQWYRKTLEERIRIKTAPYILYRTAGFLIHQLIKLNKNSYALTLMDSLVRIIPPETEQVKAIAAQDYAYCFDALKRYPEAEKNFLSMIPYFRDIVTDTEVAAIAYMDIGGFYLQRGEFNKAHLYLDTALYMGNNNRLFDQQKLFQMRFIADSALGNYLSAIKNLQRYKFIHDSIYNERKSRQIEELTIKYETAQKEQSIRLLEKEKRWIAGVALLLLVIIGLLINHSRIKQLSNKQIENKNNSLQQLVTEKEWLVREIHHRVKNNFHIVMGLLRTQAAYLQGKEAIQAIAESRQRIQAMSLVHQKLYQSDNLSAINMADYIHELIDDLKDSFDTSQTIRFNLQIEPIKLHVSHCIPLGLILNEAITNAIKHAFNTKEDNRIIIALQRTPQHRFLLSIKDNGIGLPADFDSTRHVSMGMKLMRGLGDDIDATLQINSNNGTEILIDFTCET